jgi:hypothetical protein
VHRGECSASLSHIYFGVWRRRFIHSIEVTLTGLSSDLREGILDLGASFLGCSQSVIRNPNVWGRSNFTTFSISCTKGMVGDG